MKNWIILVVFIAVFSWIMVGCSMTAGGDMTTNTQVNPTVSPDLSILPKE